MLSRNRIVLVTHSIRIDVPYRKRFRKIYITNLDQWIRKCKHEYPINFGRGCLCVRVSELVCTMNIILWITMFDCSILTASYSTNGNEKWWSEHYYNNTSSSNNQKITNREKTKNMSENWVLYWFLRTNMKYDDHRSTNIHFTHKSTVPFSVFALR